MLFQIDRFEFDKTLSILHQFLESDCLITLMEILNCCQKNSSDARSVLSILLMRVDCGCLPSH